MYRLETSQGPSIQQIFFRSGDISNQSHDAFRGLGRQGIRRYRRLIKSEVARGVGRMPEDVEESATAYDQRLGNS